MHQGCALTDCATLAPQRSLRFSDPHMVIESPNKDNISYVVQYKKKNISLSDYFRWIVDEVIEHGVGATRTIIYCQKIKQMLLGAHIHEDPASRDARRVLLEMLHSCSPICKKENILESFQSEGGCVRILVATIAFGMGVDCKQVHRTIHFGLAKNVEALMQETGRAGRDGTHSTSYLLYQSFQMTHVEKDIKSLINSKSCKRKFLLDFFDVECSPKKPLHLCCDNCALECTCGLPQCKILTYPTTIFVNPSSSESSKWREVSGEQTVIMKNELKKFHKSLLMALLKRDATGNLKVFNHPSLMLGFSEIEISQVLSYCSQLFFYHMHIESMIFSRTFLVT